MNYIHRYSIPNKLIIPNNYNYMDLNESEGLVLGIGCVILLWHSFGLPYNDFGRNDKMIIEFSFIYTPLFIGFGCNLQIRFS